MQKQERLIDMRQYFIMLWEKRIVIIIVAVIFAMLASGYNYIKQTKESASEKALISTIMKQNHDAYYGTGKLYTDADKPSGTYNSAAMLCLDYKKGKDAGLLVGSADVLDKVIAELKLSNYSDMKGISADDLKWMVNSNVLGEKILNIVVTDVDPKRAHDICEKVVENYIPVAKKYLDLNSIQVIDGASMPTGKTERYISKKQIVKSGIKGGIIGICGMLFLLLILFLLIDTLRTELDVEYAGFKKIGKTICKRDMAVELKKLAYTLSADYEIKNILVADVDGKFDHSILKSSIDNVLKHTGSNMKVMYCDDLQHDPIGFEMLSRCEAILLTATYGKTKVRDLKDLNSILKLVDTERIGVVLAK